MLYFLLFIAPVAQSVEQLPFKEMVEGSIPSGRTRTKKSQLLGIFSYVCEPQPCFVSKQNG